MDRNRDILLTKESLKSVETKVHDCTQGENSNEKEAIVKEDGPSIQSVVSSIYEAEGELPSLIRHHGSQLEPTEFPSDALSDPRRCNGLFELGADLTIKEKCVQLNQEIRELEEIIIKHIPSSINIEERRHFSDKFGMDPEEAARTIDHLKVSLDQVKNNPQYRILMQDIPAKVDTDRIEYMKEIKELLKTMHSANTTNQNTTNLDDMTLEELHCLEKRLSKVERSIGHLSNADIDPRIMFDDISAAIKEIAIRMIIMEDERLEVVKDRLKTLDHSLVQIQTSINQLPTETAQCLQMADKISALFNATSTAQYQNPLLLHVVDRLRDLKDIHFRKATLTKEIEAVETAVLSLESQVAEIRKIGEEVKRSVDEAIIKIEKDL